jgi:2-keto-3-deoxy-L-rhamnonate aldolase RhmA
MIVAEFGTGAVVLQAGNLMQTDQLRAGIAILSLFGLAVGRLINCWKPACCTGVEAVGWAKALLRRAHHSYSERTTEWWACHRTRSRPVTFARPARRYLTRPSAPSIMGLSREDTMPLVENKTKLKLKNNELALGFGVHHLRTSATAMLAAAADHDWLFIDMEHGAHSVHEATQLCIAALPTGVTPIVRICAGALDEGTRALDNGALGVIVPHVDTAERAKEIARAFRYPPLGTRSWGGPPAPYGFRAPGNAEAQAALNEAVLVVAMIESPQAVGNAQAIAAVEGIDCLLIGTSDLTAEMGIAGQIDHPRVVEAYEKVGAACRANGKALGMGGVYDKETASRYIKAGARMVLSGSDHTYLLAGAAARSAVLRAAL